MVVHPTFLENNVDDLVAACRRGDPQAFADLVERYAPLLARQARRRLQSARDAEDAVQETFLRAYRAFPRFGAELRLEAWLGRILRNVCTDNLRRRSAERRVEERLAAQRVDLRPLDESVEDGHLRAMVREALDRLPVSYKEAFVLRELEERPYPDVAAAMEISEVNARARVHRARTLLRQALKPVSGALSLVLAPLRVFHSALTTRMDPTGEPASLAGQAAKTTVSAVTGPMSSALGSVGQATSSSLGQAAALMVAAPVAPAMATITPDLARAAVPAAGIFTSLAAASVAVLAPVAVSAPAASAPPTHAMAAAPASRLNTDQATPVESTRASPTIALNTSAAPVSTTIVPTWTWIDSVVTNPGKQAVAAAGTGSATTTPPATGTSTAPPSSPTTPAPAAAEAASTQTMPTVECPWVPSSTDASASQGTAGGPAPNTGNATTYLTMSTVQRTSVGSVFSESEAGALSEAGKTTGIVNSVFFACTTGASAQVIVMNLTAANPSGDSQSPSGWELHGAMVMTSATGQETDTFYKGMAIPIGGQTGAFDPVPFVARLAVDEPANIANLQVAFFGSLLGLSQQSTSSGSGGASATSGSSSASISPSAGASSPEDTNATTSSTTTPTQSTATDTSSSNVTTPPDNTTSTTDSSTSQTSTSSSGA